MNVKDLEYFKKLLLKKRREILKMEGVIESLASDKPSLNPDPGELKYPTHLADMGSDTMGKELNSYFNARNRKFLKHLDEALNRIEQRAYGVCLVCGKEIPYERLQEVPHTRFCVPCKSQKEQ